MFWVSLLLISVSATGSFSQKTCYRREIDACGNLGRRLRNLDFPETSQDLLLACQGSQELGNCMAEVRESCGNHKGASGAREVVSYLSSTCQEDNPTFKVISKNLRCIKHVFGIIGDAPCTHTIEKESFVDLINSFYEEDRGVDFLRCFGRMREDICMRTIFEHHCGVETSEAAYEVFRVFEKERYGHLCTPEMVQELEPFRADYKEILKQELELQDRFEEQRK